MSKTEIADLQARLAHAETSLDAYAEERNEIDAENADLKARLRAVEEELGATSNVLRTYFPTRESTAVHDLAVLLGQRYEALESTLHRVAMRAQVQKDDEGERFFCVLCDREGALNQIDHTKDCPFASVIYSRL